MPVNCRLRVLLARLNVVRAEEGRPAVSVRGLARESGVSLSVVAALHAGHSQRVDFATLNRLLAFFARSMPVTMDDLLAWEAPSGDDRAAA